MAKQTGVPDRLVVTTLHRQPIFTLLVRQLRAVVVTFSINR
jgi:hypothetical protein